MHFVHEMKSCMQFSERPRPKRGAQNSGWLGKKQQKKAPVIVLLDNVRSLHNVGSLFRTCDAMAVEKLYLCGITAKPPHREIQKTAIGATESVNWEYIEDAISIIHRYK